MRLHTFIITVNFFRGQAVEMCKMRFIFFPTVIFAYAYSLVFLPANWQSYWHTFLLLCFSFTFFYLDQGSFPAMAAMDLTNGTTWEKDYTKNDIANQSNERVRVKRAFFEVIVGQCVGYWRRFSARWNQFISDGHRIKVRVIFAHRSMRKPRHKQLCNVHYAYSIHV